MACVPFIRQLEEVGVRSHFAGHGHDRWIEAADLEITRDGCRRAVEVSGVFGLAYINSCLIAIIITIGQVFTSSLAAYAFARLSFSLRDKLFLAYLATMMVPHDVTLIPLFVILKGLPDILNYGFDTNWFVHPVFLVVKPLELMAYAGKPIGLDSYFALIVPGLFSAWETFMLRQFFMTLPRELEDAARIDGFSLGVSIAT